VAEDALFVTTDGAPGKAAYTLYANPITTLRYRYVRNGDPGLGVEIVGTDTNPPAYRSLTVGPNGASSNDTITAWRREPALSTVTSAMTGSVVGRIAPFQTGVGPK
jgi:hypothetical protein